MDGAAELVRLAHLLRVSADTARHLARFKKQDAAEIHWIAHQIEEIAEQIQNVSGFGAKLVAMRDPGGSRHRQ